MQFTFATFNIPKGFTHLMDSNSNRTKRERFKLSLLSMNPRTFGK